jgi:demethylsterigmatocystin 6-O-methyltransferase
MDAIISQVNTLAGAANEAARKKIIDQLRELSYKLETPDDVMQRIMYLVSNLELYYVLTLTNVSES